MPKRVQIRRGTTAQHATFTGAVGEVTYDSDKKCLVVHDGVTAGGLPLTDLLRLVGSASAVQQIPTSVEINGATVGDNVGLYVAQNVQVDGITSMASALLARVQFGISAVTAGATHAMNLADLVSFEAVTLTGNLTFSASGYAAGVIRKVRVIADGSLRTLTFPAGWKFIGSAAPANIAASKVGLLELWSCGTVEADVMARWSVQP